LIAQGYLSKASDIAEHGGYLTNFFTILKPLPPLAEQEQPLMNFKHHKKLKASQPPSLIQA